jgi:hypothetical protein
MAAKKKKQQAEPDSPEEQAADNNVMEEGAPAKKGIWECPHCDTRYRADAVIARENHLARVHGLKGGAEGKK